MVLQEISDAPNESLDDNAFPSDNDPYSSTSPSATGLDYSSLPRPVPIISGLVGYSNRRGLEQTKIAVARAEQVLKRSMASDEATALSTIMAKKYSIASYGAALGASGAVYQCYRTRDIFRFPFWTPNPEKFNPNEVFKFKGPAARACVHASRVIPYFILGRIVGGFFGESWGTFWAITQTRADPRLKEFHNAMVERGSQLAAERSNRSPARQTPDGRPDPQQSPQGRKPWLARESRDKIQKQPADDDDMSPAAGNEAWPGSFDDSSDGRSTSTWQNSTSDSSLYEKEVYNAPTKTPTRDTSRDEASSTDGLYPSEVAKETANTGSTWDRIRKNATEQGPSSTRS